MDFLHYITESNEHGLPEECDERLRRLHESIQEIKTSTSVEVEYMKMEERERLVKEEAIERGLREGRIRGREEGRKEGREEGEKRIQNSIIKKMLSMGQPLEFISECTDKPVEYIREIATEEPMLVREENTYGRYNKKKSVE